MCQHAYFCIVDHWAIVIGRFEGTIRTCPFSTALVQDRNKVLSRIKWFTNNAQGSNTLRKESIHWSAVFITSLGLQEPVRAYNIMKLGVRCIDDVVDDQGQMYPKASRRYALGMHHRFIWSKIGQLLQPFLLVPRCGRNRLQD